MFQCKKRLHTNTVKERIFRERMPYINAFFSDFIYVIYYSNQLTRVGGSLVIYVYSDELTASYSLYICTELDVIFLAVRFLLCLPCYIYIFCFSYRKFAVYVHYPQWSWRNERSEFRKRDEKC